MLIKSIFSSTQPALLGLVCLLLVACENNSKDSEAYLNTPYEKSEGTATATYEQVIDFYISLSKEHPEINVQTIGETDSGYPLHLATFNPDGDFNFKKIREDKNIILINNGIHPGESDGIDATMLLYRDMAEGKLDAPKNTVLVTIPVYNVGGALNRNSTSRANQNGPEAYGFRGNAQNYDLNRDFIKTDTKNAQTFSSIFHLVKPDVFIDNHVSNGANYQYTLTHLFTQHNKLESSMGRYLHEELMPGLENALQLKGWDITPYVNVFNQPPEVGFNQFLDTPRYSTGYAALWNTLGMMVETHMLKPYKQRVEGTYALMTEMLAMAENDSKKIKELRVDAKTYWANQQEFYANWKIDTTKTSTLRFKGFKADTLISEVTGLPRLKYEEGLPFEKEISYKNYFYPSDTISIPNAYLVKKGWIDVIERLEVNAIDYFELEKDTLLAVESYRISDYQTRQNPYEGHYLHYNTKVETNTTQIQFYEGDYIIPTDQEGVRYILETLEPQAPDSFFNWNFFDTILQQKEGFSPYVFEDTALQLLEQNQVLRDSFLLKKEKDISFSKNWYAQLDWIFKRSPLYETAHMQYPVYRFFEKN